MQRKFFYNNLELSLMDSYCNNKKDFWKIVRYFVKNNDTVSTIPPLCTTSVLGEITIHSSDVEKANCLNSYFSSISSLDDSNAVLPSFYEKTDKTLEEFIITEHEIKDVLDISNVNKASGPDLISYKMLKAVSLEVSKPLAIIMNRSLSEGKFPENWKRSLVMPLYKKGDKTSPVNYRPISLLSNVGKSMERVMFKHLYNHLNGNNLIYKYQAGFLPGHSTTYQLLDIHYHICQAFENKQHACMVFCDISKAFDRVWHRGLLFKLRQNGIKGQILNWITDYLSSRKQQVQVNSATSEVSLISAGVPQGSVLGPLLFLVYANDISENLLSLTRLFADDSSLFFSATSLEDIQGIINHDLTVILSWALTWLVDFNPNKTEAMLFSLRPVTHFPSLTFNNTSIEFVDSHKHLGVTLSDNGQWHTHIESILASAYKILGIMRKLKYTFSRTALNQIYISYIRPVLEYSAIVWDGCTIQDKFALEKLQNKAARIVTGLTRSTSLDNLYRECGWVSLSERRKFQKLCFMYKCNNGQVPRYISDLIPPLVSEISNYPLRNRANLSSVRTRTEIFKMSCIPSSVLLWNSLSDDIKYAPSLVTFQNSLRNQMFNIPTVPAYFLQGNRKFSILHARLRNNCSDLNGDLYLNHLRNDSICACGNSNESSLHFLLECERFSNQRILMFRETRPFHPLSVNYLLFGKPNLSNDENTLLFQAVHRYIKNTKRFV